MSLVVRDVTVQVAAATLLQDVSLALHPGELLAIVGPNGAGKSTLSRVLAGELRPTRGDVQLDGRDLWQWRRQDLARRRAVLPQDLQVGFPMSVHQVVLLGRTPHLRGAETARDHAIADAALDAVGAAGLAGRRYPTLSGGEQQRVHLARVLCQVWEPLPENRPRYLLLDEPTAAQDPAWQQRVLRLARRCSRRGIGVAAVLHGLDLAAAWADRVAMLRGGRLVALAPPEQALTTTSVRACFDLDVHVLPHPDSGRPLVVPAHPPTSQEV